jgi:gamma-glutamyltranspeptidase / glutathione hydrolase
MRERDFFTGRSVVVAENGMAATAHPQATLTAVDVLRAGGNAVDAAIAAMAHLCVIEPHATGLGGDAFVIVAKEGQKPIGLNGSGRAPAAATLGWYREHGITEIEVPTAHAVTVPGAVDAWCRLLADHGSKSLDELLRPAIHAARAGFPVAPRVAHDWRGLVGKLARDPVTAARFLPQGRAPLMGEHFVQPELARTLEEIAAKGRAGFYEGWVAEDLVARLKARGGLHELSDFAANVPTYVTPLAVGYRGFEVLELPPNGQGLIAQIMLNVLSGYEYGSSSYSEADRIHLLAEAAKAAYARRDALVGDPDHVDVPVERLLSAHEADRIDGITRAVGGVSFEVGQGRDARHRRRDRLRQERHRALDHAPAADRRAASSAAAIGRHGQHLFSTCPRSGCARSAATRSR